MPDGGKSIVVKINNLCPSDGNPLCAAPVGELVETPTVETSRGGSGNVADRWNL